MPHRLYPIALLLLALIPCSAAELPTDVLTSTYLGSDFDSDSVTGVRIADDGTLIVAANVGTKVYPQAKVIDFPGFAAPKQERPDPAAFDEVEDYRDAAIAWITGNIPGAPRPPTADNPEVKEAIEEQIANTPEDKLRYRLEGIPDRVLSGMRAEYVQTWLGGWKGGCLLRISADGQQVLSQLRIGPQIRDMHLDGKGNIYLAAGPNGAISVAPDGVTVRPGWPKLEDIGADRIHADERGYSIVLSGSRPGTITVFDPSGKQLTQRRGSRRTEDVAIASEHGLAYFIGYKVTRSPGQEGGEWRTYPVHIAYMKTFDPTNGDDRWTNYDWRGRVKLDAKKVGEESFLPENFLNRPTNNMADTRGCRITIGDDGKLYASFESAGGNHIFRYEPRDIMTKIGPKMAGGDSWHRFVNTAASHKGVVGRYNAKTGELLKLQQFNTLLLDKGRFPKANAFRMHDGEIHADSEGRLYLTGGAPSGLPIKYAPRFGVSNDPPNFNPFPADVPSSGAYLMVMSPDFGKRLFTTRLSPKGSGHSVDSLVVDGKLRVAWGGQARLSIPSFTRNPLQPSPGWGENDGFLAMLGESTVAKTPSFNFSLIGDELTELDHATVKESPSDQEVTLRIPLSAISQSGERTIFGGAVSQARQFAHREVSRPQSFNINKGAIGLRPVSGSNLANEKDCEIRQWMAIYSEVSGPGDRLAFSFGNTITASAKKHGMSHLRYLVRDGSNWYISAETIDNFGVIYFESDSNDGLWAPVDLEAMIAANEPLPMLLDSEHDSYRAINFTNVTAIGVCGVRNWTRARSGTGITLSSFDVEFSVDPMVDPAPEAIPTIYPTVANRFQQITFSSEKSHDHGKPLGFVRWKLGDDGITTGNTVEHRFENAGRQLIELTVWDTNGASSTVKQAIDIGLEGMAMSREALPIVAHASSSRKKHWGIAGFPGESENMSVRAVSLEERFLDAPGGEIRGGGILPAHKRPFFDKGSRNVGPNTQLLATVGGKIRGDDGYLVLAVPQEQFLSGAADGAGANLSRGELYARGLKVKRAYWLIHGPRGWFISQEPAAIDSEQGDGAYRQAVADIVWLPYRPDSVEGFKGPASTQADRNAPAQVDAMGVLMHIGSSWQFGGLGATGQPLR